MKTHLILPLVLFMHGAAQASIYFEPRLAHISISGIPNVGDVGRETSSDLPESAPILVLGWETTRRINLEVRYMELDDISVRKLSNTSQILPGDGPFLQYQRSYDYFQKSKIVSVALPIDIIAGENLSLSLTPLIQHEESHILIDRIYAAYESVIAYPPPVYHKRETTTHFGAEVSVAYQIQKHLGVSLSYTYSPLKTFDAHFVSAGLRIRF